DNPLMNTSSWQVPTETVQDKPCLERKQVQNCLQAAFDGGRINSVTAQSWSKTELEQDQFTEDSHCKESPQYLQTWKQQGPIHAIVVTADLLLLTATQPFK
ncbi:hypothetical protein STEG23_013521, partial [Scotinomys teguina]